MKGTDKPQESQIRDVYVSPLIEFKYLAAVVVVGSVLKRTIT